MNAITELNDHTDRTLLIVEDERKTAARLYLIWAVKQTLANALAVLGVSAPERMDAPAAEED